MIDDVAEENSWCSLGLNQQLDLILCDMMHGIYLCPRWFPKKCFIICSSANIILSCKE